MSSSAASYDITIDRGSDWSKVLTLRDLGGTVVPITNIFTTAISIAGTTSPSVTAASLTYVSTDLWTSNGNATAPGSGTWIRVRRSGGAWEVTRWVSGVQGAGYWVSDSNPNHPAWVESWTAAGGATGSPEVDSTGMFFEGSISLRERGPDTIPFSFETVGDGTAGQVEISLPRSYSRALASAGAYRYDWFAYRGRVRSRLVAGRITARGSSTGTSTGVPVPAFGSSPSVSWGNITGTLSSQTDLQAALDAISGGGGANSVTSATTSDGTANLSLAAATVSGTLTAPHIHGNLAGSVYAHVRAGEDLLKGRPVYVSGYHPGTDTAIVMHADASDAAKMPAVGIMDADVGHNNSGHMVITGTITELNTAAYSVNAELYVATGGGFTATPPSARAQPVARVERASSSNGAVLVKVNGLSASDATASTLVRRNSSGGATFYNLVCDELDVGSANFQASALGSVFFGSGSTVNFNGTTYNYAIGGAAAAAHRTALGSGATGDQLFTADTPAEARTSLGFDGMVPKIPFTVGLESDFTTTSTSFVDVTGVSFPVEANKRYAVSYYILTNKNDTSGLAIQFTGPASPTKVSFRQFVATSSFSVNVLNHLTAFSTPSTTMNTFVGDAFASSASGIIDNGANAGTVQLQIRAVTGGTAKIYAGLYIQVTEL